MICVLLQLQVICAIYETPLHSTTFWFIGKKVYVYKGKYYISKQQEWRFLFILEQEINGCTNTIRTTKQFMESQ